MTPDASPAPSLAARIAALPQQPWPELKAEWSRLFGGEPPGHSRRFVEKRIAYRWQEIEFRKTDRNLLDRNRRRIDVLVETGTLGRYGPGKRPVAGTVLTRFHDGVEHQVLVLADGAFEHQGQRYTSLSKIARTITGTSWSGPAFFGLRSRSKR